MPAQSTTQNVLTSKTTTDKWSSCRQHQVAGRLAERDAIRALGDAPLAETVLPIEARELTGIGFDR